MIIKPDNPDLLGIVGRRGLLPDSGKVDRNPSVDVRVIPVDARKALAVARYNRGMRKDKSVKHLHQEDFEQANGIFPGQKHEQGIVANTDAHAKNYSMILSRGGEMATLYDVSSVLPWRHVNQYHAQKFGERKRRPAYVFRQYWEQIAKDMGLNPRSARLRVQELVDAIVSAGGTC